VGPSLEVTKEGILVFRIGQLGDTIVSIPTIDAIRKRHPRAPLFLLTDQHPVKRGFISSWDILGSTGWFDDVVYYQVSQGSIFEQAQTMSHLVFRLRRLRLGLVYDLSPFRNSLQLVRDRFFFQDLVGIPKLRRPAPCLPPSQGHGVTKMPVEPEWRRLLGVVPNPPTTRFHFVVPETSRMEAASALATDGIGDKMRLIAIAPGSKMPAKRWPIERFAQAGKRLLAAYPDLLLAILGGGEDSEIGNQLCNEWGERSRNLAGKLSVYGSAAVLERCVAYLGNDTGTMHLAAMVGVPCIAIFSARDFPGKWEPYGDHHIILRRDIECARCMLEVCSEKGNECLMRIDVQEVFSAGQRVLEGGDLRERKAETP